MTFVPRVLIAAASDVGRSWFATFPTETDTIAIVAVVALDESLSAHAQEWAADVLVVDALDADGDRLLPILESVSDPGVDMVLVRNSDSWRDDHADLMRAGVRAFLSRHPTLDELEALVRAVRVGLVVFEPSALQPAITTATGALAAPPLTPREIDVLNGLAAGHSNKQIAARLGISEHTVKTHLAALFEKLDVSNRTEAVTAGVRLGLVLL